MPDKRKRSIPFRNAFDSQRYIAKLINRVERGEIESIEAVRLSTMATAMLKHFEQGEIEARIRQLEQTTNEMNEASQ